MADESKAFIKAAKAGDIDALNTLLKTDKTVLAAKDSDGFRMSMMPAMSMV